MPLRVGVGLAGVSVGTATGIIGIVMAPPATNVIGIIGVTGAKGVVKAGVAYVGC